MRPPTRPVRACRYKNGIPDRPQEVCCNRDGRNDRQRRRNQHRTGFRYEAPIRHLLPTSMLDARAVAALGFAWCTGSNTLLHDVVRTAFGTERTQNDEQKWGLSRCRLALTSLLRRPFKQLANGDFAFCEGFQCENVLAGDTSISPQAHRRTTHAARLCNCIACRRDAIGLGAHDFQNFVQRSLGYEFHARENASFSV